MKDLFDLLFPPTCAACDILLPFRGLDRQEPPILCPACSKRLDSETKDTCGFCGKEVTVCACLPPFLQKAGCESFRKAFYYRQGDRRQVQNRLLFAIKDAPSLSVVEFFAERLETAVEDWVRELSLDRDAIVLVPIPRSRKGVWRTGTDQAKRLAKAIGERCDLPTEEIILRYVGRGREQKRLGSAERRRNAKRSFYRKEGASVKGKTVILVDDIVTTGASMSVAAGLVRRAGAERVLCLAVAADATNKTPLDRQPHFRI